MYIFKNCNRYVIYCIIVEVWCFRIRNTWSFIDKLFNLLPADATVRSTFEKDYAGSIFQQDPDSPFWWSIVSVRNLNRIQQK